MYIRAHTHAYIYIYIYIHICVCPCTSRWHAIDIDALIIGGWINGSIDRIDPTHTGFIANIVYLHTTKLLLHTCCLFDITIVFSKILGCNRIYIYIYIYRYPTQWLEGEDFNPWLCFRGLPRLERAHDQLRLRSRRAEVRDAHHAAGHGADLAAQHSGSRDPKHELCEFQQW